MVKYRQRPIDVEAVQWFPGEEVAGVDSMRVCHGRIHDRYMWFDGWSMKDCGWLYSAKLDPLHCERCGIQLKHSPSVHGEFKTPGGWTVRVYPGDWVVTHANGERTMCSPENFEAMYELIQEKEPCQT